MRRNFVLLSTLLIVVTLLFAIYLSPNWYVVLGIIFLLTLLGYYDMFQKTFGNAYLPGAGKVAFFNGGIAP